MPLSDTWQSTGMLSLLLLVMEARTPLTPGKVIILCEKVDLSPFNHISSLEQIWHGVITCRLFPRACPTSKGLRVYAGAGRIQEAKRFHAFHI